MNGTAFARAWVALLATAIITAPAAGAAPDESAASRTIIVSPASRTIVVGPADLSSGASIERLRKRLWVVARSVCNEQYPGTSTLFHSRTCYTESYQDASAQLDRLGKRRLAALATASIVISAR